MTIMPALHVCMFLGLLSVVMCYPSFLDKIPNGRKVPCPIGCTCTTQFWVPVGHYNNERFTPAKNQFGLDFRAAGLRWTTALCNQDSDQDGKSNGVELGDPHCLWTVESGNSVPLSRPSGHPGICEPVGSPNCTRVPAFTCECLTGQGCAIPLSTSN